MFLYGIGILYGRQFFEGLSGPGRIYNLLAFVAVIAALLVSLALGRLIGVGTGEILGVFAGSMTSTPDPAGGSGPDRRQVSVDRLLGQLPVRRHWTDPLLLLHDQGNEAHVSAGAGALPHGGDHHRAIARRSHDAGRCR